MFRPPFVARLAAGAAVYALEEARRLPATAMNLPITAISQLLQTTMHAQQFVTSLALKGDEVFDQLINRPQEQPAWATFDEDDEDGAPGPTASLSRFDLYAEAGTSEAEFAAHEPASTESEPESATLEATFIAPEPEFDEPDDPEPDSATTGSAIIAGSPDAAKANGNGHAIAEPEVATRYDYLNMTLAQLRARLRMLTLGDLDALLTYERQTRDRAAFVTMLTNRIATVQAQ
ncbi:lipid droplet-associated protein [Nocardia alni]|uniref:lipid droplet-associated protein n=1 Tax=Nocardia alni TaxID=2815723 RepID=UPI001C246D2B|nr:lipid droplet-associated protein [Nocardia alni]